MGVVKTAQIPLDLTVVAVLLVTDSVLIGTTALVLYFTCVFLLTVSSPRCTISYSLCIDIDECTEGIDGCNQTCTNTIGSYACSCRSGYHLANDGRRCNGKTYILIV